MIKCVYLFFEWFNHYLFVFCQMLIYYAQVLLFSSGLLEIMIEIVYTFKSKSDAV